MLLARLSTLQICHMASNTQVFEFGVGLMSEHARRTGRVISEVSRSVRSRPEPRGTDSPGREFVGFYTLTENPIVLSKSPLASPHHPELGNPQKNSPSFELLGGPGGCGPHRLHRHTGARINADVSTWDSMVLYRNSFYL